MAAIGLGGVWCWKKKSTDELIADLAAIEWGSRDVYIVFDYDTKEKTRRQVSLASKRLAKALKMAAPKKVCNVDPPPGPGGMKQGVDDFLVAHNPQQFIELVESALAFPTGIRPIGVAAGRTDAANAVQLIDRFGREVRWKGAWRKWLIWDGRQWRIDQALKIEDFAKQVGNKLWKEIAAYIATGDTNKSTMNAMYSFAKVSNSANGIRSIVALARSEPGVPIAQSELDSDPWLLNVENGTIDLRTGKLREHCRDDRITKLVPVQFDPTAMRRRWQRFLKTMFAGNDELIEYIKHLVGYTLTGVTEEHILPFCYGTGANGKSTFIEVILALLGCDYAMKAAPDLLMFRRGELHPTDKSDLFGKRFVAVNETEDGDVWLRRS